MKYDAVIIGSGLGGLQCGFILSREGYNVCIIEKNSQLGGCLQTFRRRGTIFDTGMHYIGSMDHDQILERYFRYFGLSGRLKLKRMEEDGYDVIRYGKREYKFSMGYDLFRETMLQYFPREKEGLEKYILKLREIGKSADIFNPGVQKERQTSYFDYFSTSMDDFLRSITSDPVLRNVLLGLSPLYSGVKEKTPLYIPMIIHASFINSAYRFIDGGSQIADLLAGSIKSGGGTIITKAEATKLIFRSGSLAAVEINNSEIIEGKLFISGIHPSSLLKIAGDSAFKPAYRSRIESIGETNGVFTLYMSMKKSRFPYINRNFYVFRTEDVWNARSCREEKWPGGYMMHFTPSSDGEGHAGAVIVNTYMNLDEVSQWRDTITGRRGDEYNEFKLRKAERLFDALETEFPGIRSMTQHFHTSTPLTYRDYIGSPTGSIYGMQKDYNQPLRTMVMPRTRVPNLFLTGQNINVHGVLGVTLGSVLTCGEILGTAYIVDKMKKA
ncbi:MAG TPA: NAD(P)/FAD-dependent oxidoreductase [Bacteroidales bacterium]|nr:NAD(P)/FAD-dependent oxidoreductase [Bacteroidales bacterium]HPF02516.1 NAD(P)/FAD-dependent oxidoreductase [Bacteroidales bacterium]HPJ58375.1 NAD(P)/FAD-dependent oxidoreductase [Bacteroidales bacterium]HPR10819.1 NAD(P)/FAD-dependent oxidoreductase [Bacteroidales bacterium]